MESTQLSGASIIILDKIAVKDLLEQANDNNATLLNTLLFLDKGTTFRPLHLRISVCSQNTSGYFGHGKIRY